jgi:hypothetical protein
MKPAPGSTYLLRPYRLVLLIALLFAARGALADAVGRGAGLVRDSSGAVVAGARVTLTRTSTNAAQTRISDAGGAFEFLELAPDTYTLSVEATGFKHTTLSQVVIQVDRATTLDVILQPGEVSEVLNVDAAPPLIDTQQNTLSSVVEPELPRPRTADARSLAIRQRQSSHRIQRCRSPDAVKRLPD